MNKKEFYRLEGLLEAEATPSLSTVINLFDFTVSLLDLIENSADDWDDLYGTEGWEHAIGWD